MAKNTAIAWCDHTVNFWWGCAKVSPGCENCYAETLDARFQLHKSIREGQGSFSRAPHWGPDAPRLLRVAAATKEALRYQRKAEKEGRRFRVFTNSMADFFEDRLDMEGARLEALDVMRRTPNLDWLILTKRPENILRSLDRALDAASYQSLLYAWIRAWVGDIPPANVWLGTTAENQEWANKRIPALLQIPAAVRFLSCEPLLGPLNLTGLGVHKGWCPTHDFPGRFCHGDCPDDRRLDWVICGGESGPHARHLDPDWARSLRDQCAPTNMPFLFKSWGNLCPGRLLDGMEHDAFPEVKRG